jgi:membrane protein
VPGFLSFGMVLFIGFLLAVSLALNAAIAAMGRAMFAEVEVLLQVATLAVTLGVTTVLFAMIYKVLPHARTAGRRSGGAPPSPLDCLRLESF